MFQRRAYAPMEWNCQRTSPSAFGVLRIEQSGLVMGVNPPARHRRLGSKCRESFSVPAWGKRCVRDKWSSPGNIDPRGPYFALDGACSDGKPRVVLKFMFDNMPTRYVEAPWLDAANSFAREP